MTHESRSLDANSGLALLFDLRAIKSTKRLSAVSFSNLAFANHLSHTHMLHNVVDPAIESGGSHAGNSSERTYLNLICEKNFF